MRILRFLSKMDDQLVNYFQRFCNWLTRKTGIGAVNVIILGLLYTVVMIISSISGNADRGQFFALLFTLAFCLYVLLYRIASGLEALFEFAPFKKAAKYMRGITLIVMMISYFQNFVTVKWDVYVGGLFIILHLYLMTIKPLPPCKGELWEKKESREPVAQESKA